MALSIRFLPRAGRLVLVANDRRYPVSGTTVDVPYPDGLAIGDDQALRVAIVGPTADRPTPNPDRIDWPPAEMFDLTLNKQIFWRGAGWVDASGAAA